MILKKRIFSLLCAVCLCIGLLPGTALAAGGEITVTGPESLPAVGERFTVQVDVAGVARIGAVDYTLKSNSSVVRCVDITAGDVLEGMGFYAVNPNAQDGAMIAAANANGVPGNGTLAVYTYEVVGTGDPNFRLANLNLAGQDGEKVQASVRMAVSSQSGTPTTPTTPMPPTAPTTPTTPENPGEITAPETPEMSKVSFTDVSGHWAEDYILQAAELGLFKGNSDGSFRPNAPVTRAAFVIVLWRMAGKPQPQKDMPFTDMDKSNEEFRTAVRWAYEKGYVNGRTATTFDPNTPVNRQEAMKILFGFSGGQSGMESMFTSIYDDKFPDSGKVGGFAKPAVYWGIYHGLISGTTSGLLNPRGTATRAQLAKILTNYCEKFSG